MGLYLVGEIEAVGDKRGVEGILAKHFKYKCATRQFSSKLAQVQTGFRQDGRDLGLAREKTSPYSISRRRQQQRAGATAVRMAQGQQILLGGEVVDQGTHETAIEQWMPFKQAPV